MNEMIQRIKPYLRRMGKAAFVWCAFIGIGTHGIIFHVALMMPNVAVQEDIMSDINLVEIVGRLGSDSKEHHSDTGLAIAGMSIATNRSCKDKRTGKWQKRVDWHQVSAFGKRAEWCFAELKKGSLVHIMGRLQTDVVEDKYGQKRYYTKIVAHEIDLE